MILTSVVSAAALPLLSGKSSLQVHAAAIPQSAPSSSPGAGAVVQIGLLAHAAKVVHGLKRSSSQR